MNTPEYLIGFQTQAQEVDQVDLKVDGSIPEWLSGNLVRPHPAIFEIGIEPLQHWFDGLCKLHKFSICNQQLQYSSKFLASNAYIQSKERGKLVSREFGTNPSWSLAERLSATFSTDFTDNGNVNMACLAQHCLALTETPFPVEFDLQTLSTIGNFKFDDQLTGHITTAHPHCDSYTKTFFNLLTKVSLTSAYQIYCTEPDNARRKLITSIPVKEPGYIHSFAMTERYLILVEFPLLLNSPELIFSGKPYIENYHWKSGRAARFLVIDKLDATHYCTFEYNSCFAFHHVNAYEHGHEIIVDILEYPDSSIISSFYLKNLTSQTPGLRAANLVRYRLKMDTKTIAREPLSDLELELPRINYSVCNARPYSYLYATGRHDESGFLNQLVKVDISTNKHHTWRQEHCYPGEPVFVARPGAANEDTGVVLSVVLNAEEKKSFLLILDASNMEERARAAIPSVVPFGFHGQFLELQE